MMQVPSLSSVTPSRQPSSNGGRLVSTTGRTLPLQGTTLSADGDVVTLFAVNSGPKDMTRPIDLSAFGGEGREATVWTLTDTKRAGEPDVTNSFAAPERIIPVESKYRAMATKFDYRFPAYSLTVIRWKVK